MEDLQKPGHRLRAIVLFVTVIFGLSAAIAAVAHYEKEVREKANSVRREQAQEARKAQEAQAEEEQKEQQAREVKEREQAAREEQAHQLQLTADNARLANEKSLCGGKCTTITVLQSQTVNITHTDPNGYEHTLHAGLQRLTVALDDYKKGSVLILNGMYRIDPNGDGAIADILCLVNCVDLDEGSTHSMGIDSMLLSQLILAF